MLLCPHKQCVRDFAELPKGVILTLLSFSFTDLILEQASVSIPKVLAIGRISQMTNINYEISSDTIWNDEHLEILNIGLHL
jgi:hypothetical protein